MNDHSIGSCRLDDIVRADWQRLRKESYETLNKQGMALSHNFRSTKCIPRGAGWPLAIGASFARLTSRAQDGILSHNVIS